VFGCTDDKDWPLKTCLKAFRLAVRAALTFALFTFFLALLADTLFFFAGGEVFATGLLQYLVEQ
jgi:hypothetical protein